MNAGSIERLMPAAADLEHALATTRVTFTGKIKAIEVRSKLIDGEGHYKPALCLELTTDSPVRHTIRAEQVFEDRAVADHAAKQLKRGQVVTVTSPLVGMRIYLPAFEIVPTPTTDGASQQ